MMLNHLERLLMINPLRPLFLNHFESRRLLELGGPVNGETALEIGCGSGYGVDIIRSVFNVGRIHAFDLDTGMVKRARANRYRTPSQTDLWVGHAGFLPIADQSYDAVFTFGAIHHVIDWRFVLREVFRVLKPGGRFYAEEILRPFITHPIWRRLLDHPQEDRFDLEDFRSELTATGFRIVGSRQLLNLFGWVVVDKE
jgi:ubiquinone/menaquinone biosynthesis C-methylase UbiE